MQSQPAEIEVNPAALKKATDIFASRDPKPIEEDLVNSAEVRSAVDQLVQLESQARNAALLASDHAAENPEAERDVQRARDAADMAASGQAAVKQAARTGDRALVKSTVQRSLSNTSNAVSNAVRAADDDDHPATGTTAERTAMEAAKKEAKDQAKKAVTPTGSALKKKKKHEQEQEATHQPTPKELAAAKKQAAQKRYRGEHDNNDENDDEVGAGKKRRKRKATSEYGRKTTRIITNGTFGLIGEDTADEIVSTAGTGAQRMGEGASGIASGNVNESDRGALATGRGVRNVLRDDLGLNADLAQAVGSTTTTVLKKTGRAAIVVRDTTVGAARYVGDKADDARDLAADKYQMMWQFGRELNQLLGGLQANAKTRVMYDTDKDGKVELHEVVGVLGKYGIKDMKNVDFNGDGNITYAEIGAAIKSRGKPPAK